MQRHLATFFLLIVFLLPAPAGAADATRGGQLYQQYCRACHGSDPADTSPRLAAYDPVKLALTLLTEAQMFFLNAALSDQDVEDIAEYIGSVVAPRATPQTGWYWNAAESGRGFFFEQRGDLAFYAGFHFEQDGRATWFTAQGTVIASLLVSPMYMFRGGQTLTGPYVAPVPASSPGPLLLEFSSATTATMVWPGGGVNLVRFPFGEGGVYQPPQSGAPESGWWWYAQESGRGFAIEFQGAGMFMCGFMFDDQGNPVYYATGGAMATPTSYRGAWLRFANGQAMGAPYRPATLVDANAGSVAVDFSDARNGTLTLPDGRQIPITRFVP